MPRACSVDLRERIPVAGERREGTREGIAKRFRVAVSTLHLWLGTAREEGRRAPKPPVRGRVPVGGEAKALAEPVAEQSDARHPGRARRAAGGAHRHAAQRCRRSPGAQGARLGAGEKTRRAAEQDRADVLEPRAAWRAELAGIDPDRLIFLDETGIDTRLTRTHARAAPGRRALGKVPWGHWLRLTVIGALAREGVVAAMGVAAATSTAVFLAFVEQALIPAPRGRPGAIVVMDNLAAHKAEAVRTALDRAGLSHRYLPPYSPDLDPIEPAWAKLKTRLRAEGARGLEALEALEAALGPALAAITAQDARGWFRLSGYPAPN